MQQSLGTDGLTAGQVITAQSLAEHSTITYGSGAAEAAKRVADQLQLTAVASSAVAPNTVRLTIGADFPAGNYPTDTVSTGNPSATTQLPVTAVDATATGTQAPAPTDLTEMGAAKTPCVK